ncbi:MAG TPA: hypothetical protein VN519_06760 [Bryobacteraceae bacterium]|nr:hypothetical protein [Bryobacteraceae bacterium]
MMPALTSLHIDRALTEVSIAYMNDSLIADVVAPPLPVDVRSNKYFVYDRATFLSTSGLDANNRPRSIRRPKTEAAEIDFTLSTDSYYTEEFALRDLVTDAEIAIADSPLQPDIDATYLVTERIKLDYEKFTATIVGTRSGYASGYTAQLTTGSTGTSWLSYASANSHPFSNIRDGRIAVRKGVYREANYILLTLDSALTLADHPDYKDLYKFTNPEGLSESGLVRNLRGCTVLEGNQQYNTAAEGAAVTTNNMWVDDQGQALAVVFYRSVGVGPRTVHGFRTFEAPDDTTGVRGFQVRRYRNEDRKGQFIEASCMRTAKAVAVDAPSTGKIVGAYLISGTSI